MKLVQLKNHRENKQTVQKRQTQYSSSRTCTANQAGTEVTRRCRNSKPPAGERQRIGPHTRRMRFLDMPVDGRSCLGTAITFAVVEIKRVHGKFADSAGKRDAAVQRLGGVVTHNSL